MTGRDGVCINAQIRISGQFSIDKLFHYKV